MLRANISRLIRKTWATTKRADRLAAHIAIYAWYHNEVLTALNSAPRYRLALVRVDPRGPEHDDVRYLENPFARFDPGDFDATGHRGKWDTTWARGQEPF